MHLSTRALRGLGAGCLAIFVAHLLSISIVPAHVAAVSSRVSRRAESNEAYAAADVSSRRLRRQTDGRLQARPGYKLIRVKAPNGRRRTTTTTTTPPPEDYYYYEVPEDEVPETTTTRRPVRQRQRIRQPQRQPPPPPPRSRQRIRRPPQDYYEYNDVPSVEEEHDHYGYATQKPRAQRPIHYDEEDDRPRKKPTTSTTTTTTTTTTTLPPKPTTTLSPGYKTRSDGRIIDYMADPNFPRELNGADLTEYPFYISVPDDIKFDCDTHGDGFFASIEHHCQLFHYCFGGYRYSFLCPNYTVYDQTTFTCRFINTVQCDKSKAYYKRNDALFKESTTSTTSTVAPLTVAADTIAKEAAKLKRAKPSKSKSTTTTTTTTEVPEDEEYYEDEYEDETPSPSSSDSKPSTPSTTSTTTTTTTTTTTSTTSRPPPLLAGRKARLNRLKLQKARS